MKALLNQYPKLSRFILAIVLLGLALILSGLVDNPFLKRYFPYTSVIFLTIATWVLFKTDKQSLNILGLNISVRNLSFLPLGILLGSATFLATKYARAVFMGETIALSETIDYSTILYGLYIILPTVAVEEFLFRGYLFKKIIEFTNVVTANIIFSVLFTLVHVFDENAINNKGVLIFLAVSIPVGHVLFATALLKSKTLFFPIGLHLGNNWATQHLISSSENSNSIFYTLNNATFNTWPSFIGFILIFNGIFLLLTFLIWKWDDSIRLLIKR